MKESKSAGEIIREHYPLTRKQYRRKRWAIAQTRGTHQYQAIRNSCTEAEYHRILNAVKTLYLKQGEVYFERNYKHEETENFLSMHSFISATCYLYLECDFCYDFQVEYAFDNCPFEAQIRTFLRIHPLDTRATEKELQPDFKSFFERVLKFQDPQFIHALKGN